MSNTTLTPTMTNPKPTGIRRIARDSLMLEVNHALGAAATGARLIAGGPEVVSKIGIITGGAGNMIAYARDAGLDTFITGEGPHWTFALSL